MNPVKELILYNIRDNNKFINFINTTCKLVLKVEETEMLTNIDKEKFTNEL